MSRKASIVIKGLSKTFFISKKGMSIRDKLIDLFSDHKKDKIYALKSVNLSIKRGESLGLIGKNGSGKSTLLKIILGSIDPDPGGKVYTEGKIIRLALGRGFDMNLSARDNIYLSGTILGMSFQEIGDKFQEIIAFAELQKFVDTPVKFFSSGMVSRLSFSIAMASDADIYLIDEFFADVGDEVFQEKTHQVFKDKLSEGKTLLHVSHSRSLLQAYCTRFAVINEGHLTEYADFDQAINQYLASY